MEKPKIGLALGCGAARCLAHIGVLKVLEKYQIPVDIVTGTSMGAFIGGAYASGIKVSVMEEISLNADWKLNAMMFFPTISFSGFINGKRIKEFLKNVIGNRNIEELDRKFACVATDILTGDEIVIDQGSLIEAIRASISIPTIFTPVYHGNRFLVDGGIVNPVPVDLARRMGADIVIAVNVIPLNASPLKKEKMKKEEIDYQKVNIALANNLKNKIDELIKFSKISEVFKKEEKEKYFSPNFINVTLNTINIFEREIIKLRLEKDKPDFLIEPDTSNANLKVFYKGKEAIQAGEEAASKIIPAIKKYIERKQKWIQKELS
ncbi:MAG: patatin-like phospholipase family protein [Candidatus Aminicenantes bacterium]|nr:patatin-like phospholipase family protein [Candidatus Aminicenantes bacterium]